MSVNKWFRSGAIVALTIVGGLIWSCSKEDNVQVMYSLDSDVSVAEWKGYHGDDTYNRGTIAVKSSSLYVENGTVSSGDFRMPLISLVNFNLPTDELKNMLITHLQSADFFDMAINPDVLFSITEVMHSDATGGPLGNENHTVSGGLTILGRTHEITFPAYIHVDEQSIAVEAFLHIDRMKWGLDYASDLNIPDPQRIKPTLDIHLKLKGNRD